MVLGISEAELANGHKRGRGKTRIGSRNVVLGVGMWVTGYELSTRPGDAPSNWPEHWQPAVNPPPL